MSNDYTVRGAISRLVGDRGFGFIRLDLPVDGIYECFFHKSALPEDVEFAALHEGQTVKLTLDPHYAKGPRAIALELTAAPLPTAPRRDWRTR